MLCKRAFLVGALSALFASASYGQTTYTYIATDDIWNDDANWTPSGGPPGALDTAVIPDGKTCRIESSAQADTVDVQSGGTLRIDSTSLTIDDGSSLTVNGDLQFKKSSSTVPSLVYLEGDLTISGAGTIDAADGDPAYGPGIIQNAAGKTGDLTISNSSMTLKGSLKIDINGDLHNSGTFLVDDADDTMEIGPLSSGTLRGVINGAGNFTASAGTLKIGRMALKGSPDAWTGTVTASGGTFHLTEYVVSHLGHGNVQLNSGGTIKVDALWISQGGYTLTEGDIIFAPGMAAYFEP